MYSLDPIDNKSALGQVMVWWLAMLKKFNVWHASVIMPYLPMWQKDNKCLCIIFPSVQDGYIPKIQL